MRSLVLVFLCFCLAVSGTAAAVPMRGGMAPLSTDAAMMLDPDCPDRADAHAMPSDHDDAAPVGGTTPDCCKKGSCQCASAHGVGVTSSLLAPARSTPTVVVIATISDHGYASPALARLVRPPIS